MSDLRDPGDEDIKGHVGFVADDLAEEDVDLASIQLYLGLFEKSYEVGGGESFSAESVALSGMMGEYIEEMFEELLSGGERGPDTFLGEDCLLHFI